MLKFSFGISQEKQKKNILINFRLWFYIFIRKIQN